jgi:hypothetical protein
MLAGDQVAGGAEALDRAAVRQWRKDGDRAAPVGDLDRLASHQREALAKIKTVGDAYVVAGGLRRRWPGEMVIWFLLGRNG